MTISEQQISANTIHYQSIRPKRLMRASMKDGGAGGGYSWTMQGRFLFAPLHLIVLRFCFTLDTKIHMNQRPLLSLCYRCVCVCHISSIVLLDKCEFAFRYDALKTTSPLI